MKVYSTITPEYRTVCEKWLVSSIAKVEPALELNIECFTGISGAPDFQSDAFRTHNIQKNQLLVSWIRQNRGTIIFLSDSDIIYFQPFVEHLIIQLGDADLALSQEGPWGGYNIGQIVIRCSESVALFFENIGEELTAGAWDQEAINRLLPSSGLRTNPLSRLFSTSPTWNHLDDHERARLLSFHATSTAPSDGKSSIQLKQERFDDVLSTLERLQSQERLRLNKREPKA